MFNEIVKVDNTEYKRFELIEDKNFDVTLDQFVVYHSETDDEYVIKK